MDKDYRHSGRPAQRMYDGYDHRQYPQQFSHRRDWRPDGHRNRPYDGPHGRTSQAHRDHRRDRTESRSRSRSRSPSRGYYTADYHEKSNSRSHVNHRHTGHQSSVKDNTDRRQHQQADARAVRREAAAKPLEGQQQRLQQAGAQKESQQQTSRWTRLEQPDGDGPEEGRQQQHQQQLSRHKQSSPLQDSLDSAAAASRSPAAKPPDHAKALAEAAAAAAAAAQAAKVTPAVDSAAIVMQMMQGASSAATAVMSNPQQKAKLIWGAKRDAAAAGVAPAFGSNRWETAEFGDSQQKQKFQRLMGAHHAAEVPARQQRLQQHEGLSSAAAFGAAAAQEEASASRVMDSQTQQKVLSDVEKQFIAGLRRADGRTVGLGL